MKKYLFDAENFDDDGRQEEAAYSEEQLALAREQARAQGRAEGLKEARDAQEERIALALEKISAQAAQIIADEDRREIEKNMDAVRLAMKVAHKLLPQFAQAFALAEIERTILESISARRDEPRIAVTVPTAQLEALKERIDALALEKGFAGRMILVADDALGASDCRVEWADGGAERLYERLFSQVEGAFATAVAGMQSALDAAGATTTSEPDNDTKESGA